jgi:ubiquinol-cytochrome c reductase iron-sulfur subunit
MADTHHDGETRRDFLHIASGATVAMGAACVAWPFIHQLNPAADTLALSTTEFDLSLVEEGMSVTIVWRGKPVFVRHRTAEEIEAAGGVSLGDLPDPQADSARASNPQYLVLVGVCTHLGCVPLGQKATDPRGDYGGWFCPCHGSHYDTAGRIRKGPAPENLHIPTAEFVDETTILLG